MCVCEFPLISVTTQGSPKIYLLGRSSQLIIMVFASNTHYPLNGFAMNIIKTSAMCVLVLFGASQAY